MTWRTAYITAVYLLSAFMDLFRHKSRPLITSLNLPPRLRLRLWTPFLSEVITPFLVFSAVHFSIISTYSSPFWTNFPKSASSHFISFFLCTYSSVLPTSSLIQSPEPLLFTVLLLVTEICRSRSMRSIHSSCGFIHQLYYLDQQFHNSKLSCWLQKFHPNQVFHFH